MKKYSKFDYNILPSCVLGFFALMDRARALLALRVRFFIIFNSHVIFFTARLCSAFLNKKPSSDRAVFAL